MPYPITAVPTDNAAVRDARAEQTRAYIEQRLMSEYTPQNPDLLLNVVVARRSDYDEVKVFMTEASLVNKAKEFMRRVEDELASEGIAVLTYVRTRKGPASRAA